jgi:hypothetical protein
MSPPRTAARRIEPKDQQLGLLLTRALYRSLNIKGGGRPNHAGNIRKQGGGPWLQATIFLRSRTVRHAKSEKKSNKQAAAGRKFVPAYSKSGRETCGQSC